MEADCNVYVMRYLDTWYFTVNDNLTHILHCRPQLTATWSTSAALSLKASSKRTRAPGNATSTMRMRTRARRRKRFRSSPSVWPGAPALGQDNSAEVRRLTVVKVRWSFKGVITWSLSCQTGLKASGKVYLPNKSMTGSNSAPCHLISRSQGTKKEEEEGAGLRVWLSLLPREENVDAAAPRRPFWECG